MVWLGVGTPASVPGMIPEVLHTPRCSIGCTGPGAPLGGGAAASTTGGLIASADGEVASTGACINARTAVQQANLATRFID
jgi:hypothetical protein